MYDIYFKCIVVKCTVSYIHHSPLFPGPNQCPRVQLFSGPRRNNFNRLLPSLFLIVWNVMWRLRDAVATKYDVSFLCPSAGVRGLGLTIDR
jgi:hypothetical protein